MHRWGILRQGKCPEPPSLEVRSRKTLERPRDLYSPGMNTDVLPNC